MENQHRKINGYRELCQEEIDLMNKVKALGVGIESVLIEVSNHIKAQRDGVYKAGGIPLVEARMDNATPERFLALAKTDLQTALMYATRAVAQPEFF
jgi:hypothetical protein